MKIKKQILKKWFALPFLAIFVFMLTQLASVFPQITEKWYSQKIYKLFAIVLSYISSVFPFSLDDLFYFLIILAFILLIVLIIFKRISFKKALNKVLNLIACCYVCFYFFWGFNYFRSNLNSRLNISEQSANDEIFLNQLGILIENTNKSYCTFDDFDKSSIDSLIELSYKKLAPALNIHYPSGKREAKKITLSGFFAKAGISGYYGPFFSEIHVNDRILPVEYPFVLAHEKAHQFGITSEAEANFYAWLVCVKSNSKQLQYSANLSVLRFFLYQGFKLKDYPEIISHLNENVKSDFKRIREHWDKMRSEKVDEIATKVNDAYLKSNKIEKGIEDYTGVEKFVMDFTQDTAFQKKWNLNWN